MSREIKNILVFTNTLDKGGAERQAILLAQALKSNYYVWVGVFYGSKVNQEYLTILNQSGIQILFFSGNALSVSGELIRCIHNHHIDCIFSFLYTTNLYSAFFGKLCGVKYLIGGFRSSRYKGKKLRVQRFLHNHILTASIVNSYCGQDFLIQHGLKADTLFVIHNAFTSVCQIQHRDEAINARIISVGRFVPEKDYQTAISVINRIRINRPDLVFSYLIIGYGSLEGSIRSMISSLHLDDVIQVLINPEDVPSYLYNSDIFLQTSLFEGTSNAILEAMYAQLPIVATNVGDNSYLVQKENGYLAGIRDVEKLTSYVIKLLDDKDLRVKMGNKSRQIVCKEFSVDVFRDNNVELLKKLSK